jgi:E3 ubiquitin-protein transferase RMND5
MDLLQKEHDRLWKRTKSSKSLDDVQATIDLLQEARNTIAAGRLLAHPCPFEPPSPAINNYIDPTKASITLAKLQNPVKAAFDATNDSLKETYSGLNKYSKALDKVSLVLSVTFCLLAFDLLIT